MHVELIPLKGTWGIGIRFEMWRCDNPECRMRHFEFTIAFGWVVFLVAR